MKQQSTLSPPRHAAKSAASGSRSFAYGVAVGFTLATVLLTTAAGIFLSGQITQMKSCNCGATTKEDRRQNDVLMAMPEQYDYNSRTAQADTQIQNSRRIAEAQSQLKSVLQSDSSQNSRIANAAQTQVVPTPSPLPASNNNNQMQSSRIVAQQTQNQPPTVQSGKNRAPLGAQQNSSGHAYPDWSTRPTLPKMLAIYFPQFHADPLNDKLWGNGFTDWDSLRAAPARNRKNYTIARPTELGYYDLRNTTIRKRQGELAKEYGLDGFVYHHYWFYDPTHPGPSLAAPLEDMLVDGHPNISFCLHWVMENWTDTWNRQTINNTIGERVINDVNGKDSETILQKQHMPSDPEDERISAHYKWLRQFFHHPNYIKVEGKPVFMAYRNATGSHLVLRQLTKLAKEDGFPGLFLTLASYTSNDVLFPRGIGLGALADISKGENVIFDRLTNYPYPFDWTRRELMRVPQWCFGGKVPTEPRTNNLLGVVTAFDNTPRRDSKKARLWVTRAGNEHFVQKFRKNLWSSVFYHACCWQGGGVDQFVLINAWNEWAEGMMMEPSDEYGRAFLKGVKDIHRQFASCRSAMKK